MTTLAGKVTIITGAATGLGEATARRFAAEGALLVLCDIDEAGGAAVARELGAEFVKTDVTCEGDVEAAVARAVALHGRLDCMINNAGAVGPMESIADITQSRWNWSIDILLNSVFYGMKHAARVMIDQGDGCILSTASVSAVAAMGPHHYVAAKHAVIGLTKSVASELAASGIRVNAVAPGAIPTRLAIGLFGNEAAARENAARRHPLKRVIEADDIAAGFAYFAGDSGRNITGQVLTIDGGLTACPEAARYEGGRALKFGVLNRDS
jgi:NAD(P)-dependent dehydrogenase (short-subunit alcohol dehydrogenase family)